MKGIFLLQIATNLLQIASESTNNPPATTVVSVKTCLECGPNASTHSHHDITRFFGTKRIYPFPIVYDSINIQSKGYTLVQVQLVARHGSRNPTSGYIRKYDKLAAYIALNNHTNNFLSTWKNPFNESEGGLLLPHGLLEMRNLATRARQRYSESIFIKASAHASKSSRVINSALAFLYELYTPSGATSSNYRGIPHLHTKSREKDNTLVFFENCREYTRVHPNGTKKKAAHPEVKKWKAKTFPRIIAAVQRRANFSLPMNENLMYSMYSLCVYQTVLDPLIIGGGFCDFFSDRDLSELLYAEDLGFYYGFGYPYEIHAKMTCNLITSLVSSMKSAISHPHKSKSSVLMFAHDETMIPLATALGLFKDDFVLRSDTFSKDRRWVTSAVGPFGVNMWFELYKLNKKNDQYDQRQIRFMSRDHRLDGDDMYAVKLLHNEVAVAIPGCSQENGLICPFDEFVNLLAEKGLVDCDFDAVCANK